jgi:predicted transcriptional regulator
MSEATTNNRREKRKASRKGPSLLTELEDDFLDIEENFRPIAEADHGPAACQNFPREHLNQQTNDQSGIELVINKEPIGNQLVINKEPIGNQLVIKNELISNQERPISNQLVGQLVTTKVTNKESISNQLVIKRSFKELSGLQRIIVLVIFNDIKFSNEKASRPISVSYLAKMAETTIKTAKTAVQRLVKKNILVREGGKRGKGGWAHFSINNDVYNEMLHSELVTNKGSIGNQLVTNWEANRESNRESASLSSSSSNITTTTEDKKAAALEVNTSQIPEGLKKYGFSENHLKQLLRDSELPPESIQASIEAFAHDLAFEDVKRKIRSPIALIMKLLKAGQPYLSEKGFEPEEDRLFRECVQRAENRKIEKANLVEKFFDLKFEEWIGPLSDEDLLKISAPVGEDHFRREIFDGFKN